MSDLVLFYLTLYGLMVLALLAEDSLWEPGA